ncbi:hypothetical protein MRBLMI12_000428 [Microbacterium sp. LMI12-1-1.1]|uniref:hypothetical protein n=1 Tax=Microbacterium sp. LMI12-1-1.1 TaxID=3135225 RepID=UPI00342902D7
MRTIKATGDTAESTTLSLSGGAGNRIGQPEIHVIATSVDERGETRRISAWFPRNALLDALHDADAATKATRLTEPAASL